MKRTAFFMSFLYVVVFQQTLFCSDTGLRRRRESSQQAVMSRDADTELATREDILRLQQRMDEQFHRQPSLLAQAGCTCCILSCCFCTLQTLNLFSSPCLVSSHELYAFLNSIGER